jgi:hypothetical protein
LSRYHAETPTTAADWFATDAEFRQICGDAVSLARYDSQQEFANKMVQRAKEHGLKAYITEKQLKFLCEIADAEIPARRHGEADGR